MSKKNAYSHLHSDDVTSVPNFPMESLVTDVPSLPTARVAASNHTDGTRKEILLIFLMKYSKIPECEFHLMEREGVRILLNNLCL